MSKLPTEENKQIEKIRTSRHERRKDKKNKAKE
jgi:hypothetical protein